MDERLERQLFEKFPKLFRPWGKPRQRLDGYGITIGDGWYGLIYELCEQIQKHAEEQGLRVLVTQVKQKFAGLRFYITGSDEHIGRLILEAELRSFTICELCGMPGERRTGDWLITLCDKHEAEYESLYGGDEEDLHE